MDSEEAFISLLNHNKPSNPMRKTLLKASVLCLLLSGFISRASLFAQSDPTGKKPITSTFAITNATVFAKPGSEGSKATILIKDGVIKGVGSNLSLPVEAKVIAGDSLFIYPGFIDGASQAGITKPEDPKRPENFDSSKPSDEIAGITPWRSAVDQFSIDGSQVDAMRQAGFTLIQIVPEGGMIAGKSALVILGDDKSTNVIKENTSLSSNLNGARGMYPGTTVGVMAKFRDVYKNTELTKNRAATFASNNGVVRPEITPTYQAMMDVISGQVPVLFEVGNDLEVRRALSLKNELGFQLILTGLEEYENVIDLLKSSGTKVLIQLAVPDDKAIKAKEGEDESEEVKALKARVKASYDKAIAQAGKLEAAGVPFAFTTIGAKPNDLMKSLKTMIEAGLSEEAALAALTSNAADILGVSKYAGSIESGKMANLVLATGPIFEEDSQIKHVVVDGKIFEYETKAKKKKEGTEGSGGAIAGTWDYTSETPAGSSGGKITIAKDGSSYSGSITYDDPSGSGSATSDLEEISYEGSSLTFSFGVSAGGMNLKVNVSTEISGSTMDGSMVIGDFGSFPISGTLNPTLIANK
jgi:imidazolonepropionase-like amidohydrolase